MQLLLGSHAKKMLENDILERLSTIKEKGEHVCIALFRVGNKEDDIQYEKTILRACTRLGITAESKVLDTSITEESFCSLIRAAADRNDIDGIIVFRPLPKHLQTSAVSNAIPPDKDIDGALLEQSRFMPCTAEGCMHLLKAYGIDPRNLKTVVIGRSPVVGKPLADALRKAGADLTVCHSQTVNMPLVTRDAELLFVACGKPEMIDANYLSKGQIIVDVGFHVKENGFCGDVKASDAEILADAYSPVPGGVGAVTVSVLMLHAVQAHEGKDRK